MGMHIRTISKEFVSSSPQKAHQDEWAKGRSWT